MCQGCSVCHVGVLYLADNASAAITNSWLQHLSALLSGGAAYIRDNSSLVVSNSTVQGNTAQWGAGFTCDYNSSLVVRKSLLNGNRAVQQGGGILAYKNCKVRNGLDGLEHAARELANCCSTFGGHAVAECLPTSGQRLIWDDEALHVRLSLYN